MASFYALTVGVVCPDRDEQRLDFVSAQQCWAIPLHPDTVRPETDEKSLALWVILEFHRIAGELEFSVRRARGRHSHSRYAAAAVLTRYTPILRITVAVPYLRTHPLANKCAIRVG